MPINWSASKVDDKVHKISFGIDSSSKDVPEMLVLTDLHWDSAQCDLALLKEHMDLALSRNMPVLIAGDLFDVMQGRWDPRSSQESLREEHRGGRYFDSVISTALEWFKPYKSILAIVAPGNHETSVAKRHDTNLISRFVEGLTQMGGTALEAGYWGFVQIQINQKSNHKGQVLLHFTHGSGGGAEVTRGFIDQNRVRSMYSADIYVSGHIHRRNYDENIMLGVSGVGKLWKQKQLFIRCSTYKDEIDGWHAEKGRAARPLGGWILQFNCKRLSKNDGSLHISPQAIAP